jgi:hypothetical protein
MFLKPAIFTNMICLFQPNKMFPRMFGFHRIYCITECSGIILNAITCKIEVVHFLYIACLFSSPDPKGYLRYCYHLSSIVVCKLIYFNLLLWIRFREEDQKQTTPFLHLWVSFVYFRSTTKYKNFQRTI